MKPGFKPMTQPLQSIQERLPVIFWELTEWSRLVYIFACWVIFNAFVIICRLLSNHLFQQKIFQVCELSKYQTVRFQSGQIFCRSWSPTVCNEYQQMTSHRQQGKSSYLNFFCSYNISKERVVCSNSIVYITLCPLGNVSCFFVLCWLFSKHSISF